jgi:ribosomal protein S18 acetylase RimI-like enzyme
MRPEHVKAVARLHYESLTGLLRALGLPATRAFYTGCVKAPQVMAFVAMDGDRLRGFVCGALKARALKLQALAMNPFAVTAAAAYGVLRHPSSLRFLIDVARGEAAKHDPGGPELTYIAVDPAERRSGVGRQLMDAFTSAMRAAGVPAYELSVDHENHSADSFYKRLGFERVGSYREFGIDRRRYRLTLASK